MSVFDAEDWADRFVGISFGKKGRKDQRARLVGALKKHPRLLTSRPETASRNMAGIARVLRVSEERIFDLAVSRRPALLYWRPSTIDKRVREFAKLFAKSEAEICRVMVSRYAQLFALRVGGVREKMTMVGEWLGVGPDAVRELYWRSPSLMGVSVERVCCKGAELEGLFDWPRAELARCAVKEPLLLSSTTERIMRFVEGLSAGLGVEVAQVKKLVTKLPRLVSQRPETLVGNFDGLIGGLGVDRDAGVKMISDFPALLYLDAERVVARHLQACDALGLTKEQGAAIAVQKGAILGREPRGVVRRMRLCARINAALGGEGSAGELLVLWPYASTYGMDRLLVRYAVARAGLWKWDWRSLVVCADAKIEVLLEDYAGEEPEKGGAVLALVKQRWYKKRRR